MTSEQLLTLLSYLNAQSIDTGLVRHCRQNLSLDNNCSNVPHPPQEKSEFSLTGGDRLKLKVLHFGQKWPSESLHLAAGEAGELLKDTSRKGFHNNNTFRHHDRRHGFHRQLGKGLDDLPLAYILLWA